MLTFYSSTIDKALILSYVPFEVTVERGKTTSSLVTEIHKYSYSYISDYHFAVKRYVGRLIFV